MEVTERVSRAVSKIIEVRKSKGYSLEHVANELNISLAAYDKIEKGKTKLTLERLYQIQIVLDTTLNELLDLKAENIYHQHLTDHAVGHQEIVNWYNDNRELTAKFIKNLEDQIEYLKEQSKRESA